MSETLVAIIAVGLAGIASFRSLGNGLSDTIAGDSHGAASAAAPTVSHQSAALSALERAAEIAEQAAKTLGADNTAERFLALFRNESAKANDLMDALLDMHNDEIVDLDLVAAYGRETSATAEAERATAALATTTPTTLEELQTRFFFRGFTQVEAAESRGSVQFHFQGDEAGLFIDEELPIAEQVARAETAWRKLQETGDILEQTKARGGAILFADWDKLRDRHGNAVERATILDGGPPSLLDGDDLFLANEWLDQDLGPPLAEALRQRSRRVVVVAAGELDDATEELRPALERLFGDVGFGKVRVRRADKAEVAFIASTGDVHFATPTGGITPGDGQRVIDAFGTIHADVWKDLREKHINVVFAENGGPLFEGDDVVELSNQLRVVARPDDRLIAVDLRWAEGNFDASDVIKEAIQHFDEPGAR